MQIDCAEPFRIRSAITAGVWRQCRLLSFLVSSSICVASSSGNTTTQLPVVTKAIDIRKMPASEAKCGYPVRLKGVITYYDPEEPDLFVQDPTMGVWVNLEIVKPNVPLRAGDLVEVEGLTEVPDFAPQVGNPHFKVLGRAPLPRARPVSFGRLLALEIAMSTGRPFPLVLLDSHMPGMDGFTLAEEIRKNPRLVGATIMMLTSAGYLGDATRCRQLGIAAYLVKPIRQGELLNAICAVLSGTPESAVPLVTKHTIHEGGRRLRILLAEDNAVNQTLAIRLLEKRGYEVTVAANGRLAVEATLNRNLDVVLMDIQMPEMDGFEATAAIRQRERHEGGHIPIIAMTAHALKGDKERCISAGMDSYVTKPIRPAELSAAIANVTVADNTSQEILAAKGHEGKPVL